MKIAPVIAKWLIWLLGLLLWIIHPFIMISYYEVTQLLGWYPPEADSIGIPIIGGFIVGLVGLPLFIILCLSATRRISKPLNILEWDNNRAWRSIIVTLIFGFFAISCLESIYYSFKLLDEIKTSPFIDHKLPTMIRMVLSVGWAIFWILIRSSFLTQKSTIQNTTFDT